MRRLLAVVAPLALVACGAPAPPQPKEPPPIVEMPRRAAEPQPPPPARDSAPADPGPDTAPPAAPASVTLIDLGGTPSSAPPAAPAAPVATVDPPDAGAIAEARRLDREGRERRLKEAEARVAELEKRLLAIANPFLPRPQLPPDEAQAWEGLDGVQRRERVNKQLEEARKELEAAQAAMKDAPAN